MCIQMLHVHHVQVLMFLVLVCSCRLRSLCRLQRIQAHMVSRPLQCTHIWIVRTAGTHLYGFL